MIIIALLSIIAGVSVFFAVRYITELILGIISEGRVYDALNIEKENNKGIKNFIFPTLYRWADFIGKTFIVKIKNNKIKDYLFNLHSCLKSCGTKYDKFNAYQFFVLQLFAALTGIIFSSVFISLNPIIILLMAVLGFSLPYMSIKEESKKRKDLILKKLPESVDYCLLC